jgi:hypothetical protein
MADPNQLSRQERRLVDQIHPAKLATEQRRIPRRTGTRLGGLDVAGHAVQVGGQLGELFEPSGPAQPVSPVGQLLQPFGQDPPGRLAVGEHVEGGLDDLEGPWPPMLPRSSRDRAGRSHRQTGHLIPTDMSSVAAQTRNSSHRR